MGGRAGSPSSSLRRIPPPMPQPQEPAVIREAAQPVSPGTPREGEGQHQATTQRAASAAVAAGGGGGGGGGGRGGGGGGGGVGGEAGGTAAEEEQYSEAES